MMRAIPGTDLSVHPLCLGGNVFGWSADRDASFAILDAYVEAGGNFIDTADTYSSWQGTEGGESETILGEWMQARGNRDSIVLATKVGKAPGYASLEPEAIRGGCARSLERLRTDHIDLYYAHQDHGTPLLPSLEAFDGLVQAGSVRYVAASNFTAARLTEALDLAAEHGLAPFVAAQEHYSLMERGIETDIVSVCVERGVGLMPYFSLARGYLTGKYRVGGPTIDSVRAEGAGTYVGEAGERVLAALEAVAAETGAGMPAVALAWLEAQPAVVSPIASATSVAQLHDLLPMAGLTLSADQLAALDAASASA